ncbi:MAG: hypothetical protein U0793_14810 [Gemmataceae bacterium]
MFPRHYFAARFFAPRYFPGEIAVAVSGAFIVLGFAAALSDNLELTMNHSPDIDLTAREAALIERNASHDDVLALDAEHADRLDLTAAADPDLLLTMQE